MARSGLAQTSFAIFGPTIKQDRKPKERKMSKFNNTNTFAAAAFGAAVLFSMLSFGGNAEASSVLNCKGSSAAKVASCCEKVVAENGRRPLWMMQAKMNCHDIVSCWGRQCYAKVLYAIDDGKKLEGGRGRGIK
jgi:hypothetical protein